MQNAQLKITNVDVLIIFCCYHFNPAFFLTIFSRIFTVPLSCNLFFSLQGHYLCWTLNFSHCSIIVYSGAIMILFLFTIMLMNLNKEWVHKPKLRLGAIVLFLYHCFILFSSSTQNLSLRDTLVLENYQSIKVLGKVLLNGTWFLFVLHLYCFSMIGTVYV
jgi:NADH-quinone oxidoreductase subunit J